VAKRIWLVTPALQKSKGRERLSLER